MKKKILLFSFLIFSIAVLAQETAAEWNTKGIAFAKNGQTDKAFQSFENAIKTDPNFPDAYSNRGNVYRMQKKYDLAISDYSKSIALNPNLKVIYARANTYVESGNLQNAIDDYTTIINRDPSFHSIYFDRAYAYIRLQNYAAAKKDLESQLELTPKDFETRANLIGVKKKLALYEEALADYEIIWKEFPNRSDLHILYGNRASLYTEIKDYERALKDAEKALEIKGDYDFGFLGRGIIYMKLGDEKKACQDYQKALKLGLEKNKHFRADQDFEDLKKICG